MAKSKSFFESNGFKNGMKYLYGLGAAVVILGALFKILHLPGASEALIVGLGTEAVIFAVSAFEPLPHEEKHWYWKSAYPNLMTEDEWDEEGMEGSDEAMAGGSGTGNVLGAGMTGLNKSLQDNKLTSELFENLSESINGLKVNVTNLADIADTSVATNEFADKLKNAGSKVDALGSGVAPAVEGMKSFNSALGVAQTNLGNVQTQQNALIEETKKYQGQMQAVSKNLTSLNAVYELELQDAQKHLNSINKYYGSVASVMTNLLDTSKDTDALRKEVANLATNMSSLNNVYGGMLSAMAGGKK